MIDLLKYIENKIELETNKLLKDDLITIKEITKEIIESRSKFRVIKFVEKNTGYSEYRIMNDCESDNKELWIEYDPEVRILPGDILIKKLWLIYTAPL